MQVKEGGLRELTPSILNGFDLDAPPDLLTFTLARPPAHGRLINGVYGTETSRYTEMGAELLQRSLSVTSFTLQELRQGETKTTEGLPCPRYQIQDQVTLFFTPD